MKRKLLAGVFAAAMMFSLAAGTVGGSLAALIADIVTHPVSLVLLIAIVVMLVTSSSAFRNWQEKRRNGCPGLSG